MIISHYWKHLLTPLVPMSTMMTQDGRNHAGIRETKLLHMVRVWSVLFFATWARAM